MRWRPRHSDVVVYLDGFLVALPIVIGAVCIVAFIGSIVGSENDLTALLLFGTVFCIFFVWLSGGVVSKSV